MGATTMLSRGQIPILYAHGLNLQITFVKVTRNTNHHPPIAPHPQHNQQHTENPAHHAPGDSQTTD